MSPSTIDPNLRGKLHTIATYTVAAIWPRAWRLWRTFEEHCEETIKEIAKDEF